MELWRPTDRLVLTRVMKRSVDPIMPNPSDNAPYTMSEFVRLLGTTNCFASLNQPDSARVEC
jgi:hypothetical protein